MGAPIRLHVESVGQGPGVIWHHGFGGSARNFRPQVRALRDAWTVVTYDARGHARSEAPLEDDAYTLDDFVFDLKGVREKCNSQRVGIGGLSLGAAVALRYAARGGEGVSGLVLAALPPGGAGRTWARSFAEAIDEIGVEEAGARFVWGGDRFDTSAQELIRKGFLEHPSHALSATLRGALSEVPGVGEMVDDIRRVDCPVLLVVGDSDLPSLEVSRQIAEATDARLEVIDGAGHVVNLQAADAFNALVAEFLNDLQLV